MAPVLVGGAAAAADHQVQVFSFILALFAGPLFLAGTNLTNDYFDLVQGADPPIGTSPRVLQSGMLSPRSFLLGGLAAFAGGGILGILLLLESGPLLILFGLGGALLGYSYTAPPLRLGYRGLGELTVFLLMGPGMVVGTYLATSGHLGWLPLAAGAPVGLLVAAILHANNLRDLDSDAAAGKRTLAVIFGRAWGTRELAALVLGPFGLSCLLVGLRLLPLPVLLILLVFPPALSLARDAVAERIDSRQAMRIGAAIHLRFCLLLSAGLVVRALGWL